MATTTIHAPLRWGRILLSAVLAAVIALLLIYLGGAQIIQLYTCPSIPPSAGLGQIIGGLFACGIGATALLLIVYFLAAALLSAILIQLLVAYRRLVHTLLSVILSVPVAFGLIWALSQVQS